MLTDGQEYKIFTHIRKILRDDTEEDIIAVEDRFIAPLPVPMKAIIARYSTFLPDYMLDKEQSTALAKALGDFLSLSTAQKSLLKEWGGDFEPAKELVRLAVTKNGTAYVFRYGFVYGMDSVLDEFTIDEGGNISFSNRQIDEW
jgi:hypothetical protein